MLGKHVVVFRSEGVMTMDRFTRPYETPRDTRGQDKPHSIDVNNMVIDTDINNLDQSHMQSLSHLEVTIECIIYFCGNSIRDYRFHSFYFDSLHIHVNKSTHTRRTSHCLARLVLFIARIHFRIVFLEDHQSHLESE